MCRGCVMTIGDWCERGVVGGVVSEVGGGAVQGGMVGGSVR